MLSVQQKTVIPDLIRNALRFLADIIIGADFNQISIPFIPFIPGHSFSAGVLRHEMGHCRQPQLYLRQTSRLFLAGDEGDEGDAKRI